MATGFFFIWWSIAMAWVWRREVFVLPKVGNVTPFDFVYVLMSFVVFILVQWCVPLVCSLFLLMAGITPDSMWMYVVTLVVTCGAMLFLVSHAPVHFSMGSVADMWRGVGLWWVAYPSLFLTSQGVGLLVRWIYPVPFVDQEIVKELRLLDTGSLQFWVMAVGLTTCVPIAEEILFRGFLHSWVRARGGFWAALFIPSLIFASFHLSPNLGLKNIEFFVAFFTLALFLGFARERYQSLGAPIGLHAFFNFFNLLLITS